MNDEQHRLALPQGTRIRDFEFHRVLGYGGFGITYLGWNVTLDIPVAIKEYLPADLATREQDLSVVPQTSQAASDFQWGLERFLDEARTLARFQHPNVVRVHHFFEAHSTAYIAMDYVEGEDLSAYLTRKGTLSEDELKGILYPLLDALEVVHQADFLHRDIKPGNIVLRDSDGSPVLLDFGSARQAIGAKSRSVTSIVTPGYAPIEQYSSRGRQGPWTDIYALGGVCYRALTGQVPEDATDRVRNDPLIPVAQRCAGQASQEFLSAIDVALSVDEGDRPQSVGAWREVLGADVASQQEWHQEEERQSRASSPSHSPRLSTSQHEHRQEEKEGVGGETAGPPLTTQSAVKIKDAEHLNTWFKLHCICLAAIIPLAAAGLAVFGLLAVVSGLLAVVFGLRILHKLWSLIPNHKVRTTPGKAVGFLFIPFFNLYWNFVAIYGLAKALNTETGRRSVSEVASFIYCCSFMIATMASLVNTMEDRTLIIAIGYIVGGVLWFIILKQMKDAGRLILQTA